MNDDSRARLRQAPRTTQRARQLRKEATFPEKLVWSRLRAGQLSDLRFRRQHPVGQYIVDFCCPSAKLAIELDGLSHDDRERYDSERTRYLESQGLRVIRFTNDDVLTNLEDVLFRIACEVGLDV